MESHDCDYETIPYVSPWVQMTGGAIAGIMEHCLVYPIDSVKTRMQMLSTTPGAVQHSNHGVMSTLWKMVRHEGVLRPVRGMSAVVAGAGPAHAAYFTAYENLRDAVNRLHVLPQSVAPGVAGVVATLIHDALMTPADAVKQRMQMYNSPFRSCWHCVRTIYSQHGVGVFYRAYMAQLAMNMPFQCIHFMCYDKLQRLINPDRQYWPLAHMFCGGVSGATAAAITTPIDVCKTVLNTQQEGGGGRLVIGLKGATHHVYSHSGLGGFVRGLRARVVYQIPSTAICWTVYETMKYILSADCESESVSGTSAIDELCSTDVCHSKVTNKSHIGGATASGGAAGMVRLYSGVVNAQPANSELFDEQHYHSTGVVTGDQT